MVTINDTQGGRVRALFQDATGTVTIIAPFIKVDAFRSLLEVIPPEVRIRCVTRWLTREIAAGVSDPEILDVLEERGDFSLCLVDRLHAKMYVAGRRCLCGSSNVTMAGLGGGVGRANIEILVETALDDPGVTATLEEISRVERTATRTMAQSVRRLAESISVTTTGAVDLDAPWFPRSRKPEQAFRFYVDPPSGYVGAADKILLGDLANGNLQPGLSETEFHAEIRARLAATPIAEALLGVDEDITIACSDAHFYLKTIAADAFSTNDLWLAFVAWMRHFFSDKVIVQEITEVALRRAQLLDG